MHRAASWSTFLLAIVLAISSGPFAGTALAQDATPVVGTCDAPAPPPGSPTPMDETVATPTEGEGFPPMAASPIAGGEPADANITAQVNQAVANAAACFNEGDFLGFAALHTEDGLESEFGTRNPYDVAQSLAGAPPVELIAVENIRQLEPGRYSVEITYSFGGIQLQREQWVLIAADRFLFIDLVIDLEAVTPEGAVTIEAEMVDFAFELSQSTVPANTPLVFEVTNTGEYPHELVLIQLPEGAAVEDLLDGGLGFEDITFIGVTFSEGGQPAPDLVLTGLAAGTYTLVCFIDIPDGVPHVARGMVAELTVE
jgi:hypothetical protein